MAANKGGRPRKTTAIHSDEVKQVLRDINTLSANPTPVNVVKLTCSIMQADLMNRIPSDTVERCKKFVGLLYKTCDSQAFEGLGLMGLIRGNAPSSLSGPKEVNGQILDEEQHGKQDSTDN
jgi:hypothetical protein